MDSSSGQRSSLNDLANSGDGVHDRHHRQESTHSRQRSVESRPGNPGLLGGDVIQVDMGELANVLGCGLDELLHSLRKEATTDVEGIEVENNRIDITPSESTLYPPPRVKQALVTTISRPTAAEVDGEDELPRMLWVLAGAGGKTVLELVLLNLVRGGVERIVIVVRKETAHKMKEAVERSGAASKVEFLEDSSERSRQFHAKSILRARNSFDSPFLFVTADHLFHPGLLHLLAVQDLGENGGCVLVEDAAGPDVLGNMAPTAVFVRREPKGKTDAAPGDTQASRRVMAIGRREQGRGQRWDGLECGALVLSTEIFDSLSALSKRRRYFTLADALDIFAGQGLLRSVTTEGKPWLALETKSQLQQGNEDLVQQLMHDPDFPWEPSVPGASGERPGSSSSASAGAAAAAAAAMGESPAFPSQRRLSLQLEPSQQELENQEEVDKSPDFKGFLVPVAAVDAATGGGVPASTAEDHLLERGPILTKRLSLEEGILPAVEPDLEAGDGGGGTGGAAVTLPWNANASRDVGYIVSLPGEDGGEELVFAVPEPPPKQHSTGCTSGSGGGGLLGLDACCGGGNICCGGAGDSDDEGGIYEDSDEEMDEYNCLGGGILNACLPEMPTEMPSDIRSVRVTTDLVVEKKGEEPTLAVHVIVDKRVPLMGWVLMVSALFGLAAMAPMGDLLSEMSPDTAPAVYPVWRYSCSSILYAPWFLLMVAGSKSARAELRDWSAMLPVVVAGVGLAGWGLCFYTALNFASASMVALLASLTPMCLVVWRGVTGEAVHRLEIIGVLLALAGGVVSTVGEGGGDDGADTDAGDTAAKTIAVQGADSPSEASTESQAFGIALALMTACFGGLYILNAKAARNKVTVSHFAFVASIVPAVICAVVLVAGFAGSASGRVILFGPAGLMGWTQSPGLALTQILSSLLGDVIGNFGFYLLLKYISPLVVSLASLTVPLLAVVEGLMLGVVAPPGILFGVGAALILIGAATASVVTMLPHTEVFDATTAVKLANEDGVAVDKSPIITKSVQKSPSSGNYGAVAPSAEGSGHLARGGGAANINTSIRAVSVGGPPGTDPKQPLLGGVGAGDELPAWDKNGAGKGDHNGENRPLIRGGALSTEADDKKDGSSAGSSWMPRLFK